MEDRKELSSFIYQKKNIQLSLFKNIFFPMENYFKRARHTNLFIFLQLNHTAAAQQTCKDVKV